MMKRIITVFLTVFALLALLSTQALAADVEAWRDEIKISSDGTVTLLSGHMAGEEISSLQFQLEVAPLEDATVTFNFDGGLSDRLTHASYSDNVLSVYIAGTAPLMGEGETELTLGKLSVVDLGGNSTAAVAAMAADSLQYVYGTNLMTQTTPETEDVLVNQVTPEALQARVTEAEGYDEADYTPESYAALKTALEQAQSVLDDKSAQPVDFNNAYDALLAAIKGLEPVSSGDDGEEALAAELRQTMEQAQALLESLDRDLYTKESVKELEDAIQGAENALTDADYTQQSLQEALDNLKEAMAGLDLEDSDAPQDPEETPSAQDKTIETLEKLLAEAKIYQEANYTPDSFAALQQAIAEGEAALENAALADVVSAVDKLTAAIDGLVPVGPGDDPTPTPGDDPTPSPSPSADPDSGSNAGSSDKPGGKDKEKAPNTGDEAIFLPWVMMLCICGGMLAVLLRRTGKRQK